MLSLLWLSLLRLSLLWLSSLWLSLLRLSLLWLLQDARAEQHIERTLRHTVVQPTRDRALAVVACSRQSAVGSWQPAVAGMGSK